MEILQYVEKQRTQIALAAQCQLPDLCQGWVFATARAHWRRSLGSSRELKKSSAQDAQLPGVRVCVPGLGHPLRSD